MSENTGSTNYIWRAFLLSSITYYLDEEYVMVNLILCGGSGTRLWPLSRKKSPKQYSRIFGGKSLFQENIVRNSTLCDRVLVATNVEHLPLIKEQLAALGVTQFEGLLEPVGRNTAPAIALALLKLASEGDPIVLVTPSDHRITNLPEYRRAVVRAQELAQLGYLVTFGIKPKYAETGYGYIEADGEDVRSFREKPDKPTAEAYVTSGRYYWNSGMFVFKASTFLSELAAHSPQVYDAALRAYERAGKGAFLSPFPEDMEAIPSTSIDYAVMEKSGRVKVVPCDPGWSDLGSFDALYDETPKVGAATASGEFSAASLAQDDNSSEGNAVIASDVTLLNTKRCLVVGEDKPIILDGVEDLIVVQTGDATLIMRRGQSQNVRDVLKVVGRSNPGLL